MRSLPTGTVTFLFSDIEGSTKLVQALGPARWTDVLETHQRLLRSAFTAEGGVEVTTGGDSFFVVFPAAAHAVEAAAAAQRALDAAAWPEEIGKLRVRIGLHTGEGILGSDDYVGVDVHRAARVAATAHGGQIVLSATTRALVEGALPAGTGLRELGSYRLKDLARQETISQLDVAGLPVEFPPLKTLDTPTNLPAQLTSFIGRSREIDELAGALRDGAARLVTLTGPGGSGKTRLSLATAAALLPDYPDGVFFVELAAIEDPALFAPTIATALGVKEEPGRPMEATLHAHLAGRHSLLVLDNLEQVVSAWPRISELLAAAPRVAILASSREVLHLKGEHEYPVLPLPYPSVVRDAGGRVDLTAFAAYDAVGLFIVRAQAARPAFAVTDANAPDIAEICSRLDGLPLAIELAAARVKLFEPEAILSRLSKSLGFLTGGARDVPARQQTLRGAIAWSHDLLTAPERALLRRLAAFVGGWSLEAAEAVCDPDGSLGLDVFDGLASLVDKSLVVAASIDLGEPRFRSLMTIRAFALERLEESGEAGEVRQRHARHFLALAEKAGPLLLGGETRSWLERLGREKDNLREVLRWAISGGDVIIGLRILGAAWRFWQERFMLTEGLGWAQQLLAHPDAQAPTAARAACLDGAGGLAYWLGDFEAAGRHYEASLAIADGLADQALQAAAHYGLGFIEQTRGDSHALRRHEEASLELYRRLGDADGQARARMGLVLGMLMEGEYVAARDLQEQTVRHFRERANWLTLGDTLTLLSALELRLGDLPAARRHAAEVLGLRQGLNVLAGMLGILQMTAILEMAAGRPERAAIIVGAIDALNADSLTMLPPVRILKLDDPVVGARTALGEAAFESAWARGRALSWPEALAYAGEGLASA
jgi:predicted ATPase/class 3 adenylate cyclase